MIGGDSVSDFVNTTSGIAQGVTAKFGVGGAGVVAGAVSPPPSGSFITTISGAFITTLSGDYLVTN